MESHELEIQLQDHIDRSFNAIYLLYDNEHGTHAKYLAYILIDQMAWIVSDKETQTNVYFRDWVEKYFINYYPGITSSELWASRNGHLHCHSTISRDIRRDKTIRQLWFIDNLDSNEDIDPVAVTELRIFYAVNTTKFLREALFYSVIDFKKAMQVNNWYEKEEVKIKLKQLVTPVKLSEIHQV